MSQQIYGMPTLIARCVILARLRLIEIADMSAGRPCFVAMPKKRARLRCIDGLQGGKRYRMDGVRSPAGGCRDNVGDVQVGLGAGGLPNAHCLICKLQAQNFCIRHNSPVLASYLGCFIHGHSVALSPLLRDTQAAIYPDQYRPTYRTKLEFADRMMVIAAEVHGKRQIFSGRNAGFLQAMLLS